MVGVVKLSQENRTALIQAVTWAQGHGQPTKTPDDRRVGRARLWSYDPGPNWWKA